MSLVMQAKYIPNRVSLGRYFGIVCGCERVLFCEAWKVGCGQLQDAQRAGARDSFGAALDLEFVKDNAIVSFDSAEGEK